MLGFLPQTPDASPWALASHGWEKTALAPQPTQFQVFDANPSVLRYKTSLRIILIIFIYDFEQKLY